MNIVQAITKQMDGNILCPVCSTGSTEQPLVLWAEDIYPDQDMLFCPHCDLQVHIEVNP